MLKTLAGGDTVEWFDCACRQHPVSGIEADMASPGSSRKLATGTVGARQPGASSQSKVRRLKRDELPVDTIDLARFLIGKTLVRESNGRRLAGRIVETEAYVVGDAAGHAFIGQTARNRSLFRERGHAYVYFIYGCWHCLNIASETKGVGAGVLLRAIEPTEGLETMRRLRKITKVRDLARGPGRLAAALDIDRALDGVDVCGRSPIWLGTPDRTTGEIGSSARIGLTKEADRILRYYERGNPFVSGPKRLSR
jgi:DNA-3-methyladenine glycosylase